MLRFLYTLVPYWLRPRVILELRQRASQWRAIRATHLEKEPCCQACGRTANLAVHHIVPVSFMPELECTPGNLITLCSSPCHIVFGHFMNYHCYNKDVRKMVRAYRNAMLERTCQ
jgi:hypothetical protein